MLVEEKRSHEDDPEPEQPTTGTETRFLSFFLSSSSSFLSFSFCHLCGICVLFSVVDSRRRVVVILLVFCGLKRPFFLAPAFVRG